MQILFGSGSVRLFVNALLLSSAAAVVAVGCGGDSSDGGSSKAGASSGDDGQAGDSSTGGSAGTSSGSGTSGKGSGGKGAAGEGNSNAGAPPVNSEAGEGGGGVEAPMAQNHSAVSFVTAGVLSKSKNFVLISGMGESLGGTVGSKEAKSLKYKYVPGVIAASAR